MLLKIICTLDQQDFFLSEHSARRIRQMIFEPGHSHPNMLTFTLILFSSPFKIPHHGTGGSSPLKSLQKPLTACFHFPMLLPSQCSQNNRTKRLLSCFLFTLVSQRSLRSVHSALAEHSHPSLSRVLWKLTRCVHIPNPTPFAPPFMLNDDRTGWRSSERQRSCGVSGAYACLPFQQAWKSKMMLNSSAPRLSLSAPFPTVQEQPGRCRPPGGNSWASLR